MSILEENKTAPAAGKKRMAQRSPMSVKGTYRPQFAPQLTDHKRKPVRNSTWFKMTSFDGL
jgi:hypothetical protein